MDTNRYELRWMNIRAIGHAALTHRLAAAFRPALQLSRLSALKPMKSAGSVASNSALLLRRNATTAPERAAAAGAMVEIEKIRSAGAVGAILKRTARKTRLEAGARLPLVKMPSVFVLAAKKTANHLRWKSTKRLSAIA